MSGIGYIPTKMIFVSTELNLDDKWRGLLRILRSRNFSRVCKLKKKKL